MACCSRKILIGVTGVLLVLGSLFLIGGCVLGFAVFPNMIQEIVAQNVMLKEGSQSWEMWQKLPIPLHFEVYFFNVTNIDEINNGGKPNVQEIGPYVYKEYKEKMDIVVDEISGTAAYYQKTNFVFDPELSGHLSEDDSVTIFHVALMVYYILGNESWAVGALDYDIRVDESHSFWEYDILGALEYAEITQPFFFNIFNWDDVFHEETDLFLTSSVKNILFDGIPFINCSYGGNGAICNMIKLQTPPNIMDGPNGTLKFALFNYKNNTYDGRYEVKLGWAVDGPHPTVDGVKQLGKIVRWDNSTTLTKWSGEKCNRLTGTDATIFPPFLTEDTKIDIFSTDLCRSLTATYDSDSSYKGIDALRFTAHKMLLGDIHTNPDNYCYCPTKNGCLLKGALDLTQCLMAPAIITFPHFYMAADEYLNMVSGLNPVQELHETYLDIEPNTGIPLAGGKKVQFNMQMKRWPKIKLTNNVTNALFPIAWINEGVQLDDANVNKLKDQLVNNLKIVSAVTWTLIGLGIAMIAAGLCLLLFLKFKSSESTKSFST